MERHRQVDLHRDQILHPLDKPQNLLRPWVHVHPRPSRRRPLPRLEVHSEAHLAHPKVGVVAQPARAFLDELAREGREGLDPGVDRVILIEELDGVGLGPGEPAMDGTEC